MPNQWEVDKKHDARYVINTRHKAAGGQKTIRLLLLLLLLHTQVDLAGSERVHKTNTGGQTLVEAKHINVSLFFLEMVIVALRDRGGKGR